MNFPRLARVHSTSFSPRRQANSCATCNAPSTSSVFTSSSVSGQGFSTPCASAAMTQSRYLTKFFCSMPMSRACSSFSSSFSLATSASAVSPAAARQRSRPAFMSCPALGQALGLGVRSSSALRFVRATIAPLDAGRSEPSTLGVVRLRLRLRPRLGLRRLGFGSAPRSASPRNAPRSWCARPPWSPQGPATTRIGAAGHAQAKPPAARRGRSADPYGTGRPAATPSSA
mmetsp:Transcript_21211/g.64612  ORF Transcript_21211/g.64612 Transcript_21211/m.64612 type:complete len:229 (+) Transcript_21211:603-1289(+)